MIGLYTLPIGCNYSLEKAAVISSLKMCTVQSIELHSCHVYKYEIAHMNLLLPLAKVYCTPDMPGIHANRRQSTFYFPSFQDCGSNNFPIVCSGRSFQYSPLSIRPPPRIPHSLNCFLCRTGSLLHSAPNEDRRNPLGPIIVMLDLCDWPTIRLSVHLSLLPIPSRHIAK